MHYDQDSIEGIGRKTKTGTGIYSGGLMIVELLILGANILFWMWDPFIAACIQIPLLLVWLYQMAYEEPELSYDSKPSSIMIFAVVLFFVLLIKN